MWNSGPVRKARKKDNMNGNNIVLRTERLSIRKFRPEDWRDLHEYLSDPEVVKFEPCEPFSEDQCRQEAARRSAASDFFAVERQSDGRLIGNLYFGEREFDTRELGYVFNRNAWHCGYAAESVRALMEYAFRETACRRVVAMCDPLNTASWRLLERLGMRREGLALRTHFFRRNEDGAPVWADTLSYAVLASEFRPAGGETRKDEERSVCGRGPRSAGDGAPASPVIEYREIAAGDLDALGAMFAESFNAPPWNECWTRESACLRLRQQMDSAAAFGLAARCSGELCGLIIGRREHHFDGDTFEIREFCIADSRRGGGLGTRFLGELERRLRESGVVRILLLTSDGEATEGFYRRRGYRRSSGMVLMGKLLAEPEP